MTFYNPNEKSWIVEKGLFKILVGSSSKDIRLEGEVQYIK